MPERTPRQTLRVPPEVLGVSGRVAQLLREQPVALDDVRRARMERSLIQAWRTHAAARVPLPRKAAPLARTVWAASIAASAVAGGLIAFSMFGGAGESPTAFNVGHFELRIGDAAMQSGAVAEGQVLESGAHGRIEVDLRTARLQMSRGTRVRFDRVSQPELALSLLKGRLDVDFHPTHKGEQRMSVESLAARVQVVGTRFSVDVDSLGNTEVSVREGVVEVVPRSGSPARKLSAGEHVYVRVDEGDEHERAVRAAIEQGVRSLDGTAPEAAVEVEPAESDLSGIATPAESGASAERASRAVARKLEAARRLLRQREHAAARARLRGVAEKSSVAVRFRVEALTLMAESYTAQGDIPRAAQAYRKGAELARNDAAGHNARFALARLLERHAHDAPGAIDAYKRYLEYAPRGALANQARQALCRLRATEFCD